MAEVLGRVCGFVPLRLAPAALDSEQLSSFHDDRQALASGSCCCQFDKAHSTRFAGAGAGTGGAGTLIRTGPRQM